MSDRPRVTVVMSVHNGDTYLREAVDSVLAQTFRDFEFLAIDDGSTDRTLEILRSFADRRMRVVTNDVRLGLSSALNKGLDLARGEYVARMDCDDVCLPERLARQVSFLERRPEVGACGTWVVLVGDREGEVWRYPTDPDAIRCGLLFESRLAHPSVMVRRKTIQQASLRYDPSFTSAQDYDFWVRLSERTALANVGEILMRYRVHPFQAGRVARAGQRAAAARIRAAQLRTLGMSPTDDELALHEDLSTWKLPGTRESVARAELWLAQIRAANDLCRRYPGAAMSRVLGERWFAACSAASGEGPWAWKTYRGSPLAEWGRPAWRDEVRFRARCALRRTP